ncbi:MAG: hypothetical protein NTW17_00375 [Candidatus Pacearchaeota archaeon]|nr:hypothetical protein [Candidatus Pacearchaeota archaeon]
MGLEDIEFEIEEIVRISDGRLHSSRDYTIRLKGDKEKPLDNLSDFRVGKDLVSLPEDVNTGGRIHLLQVALFLAQKAYPNQDLRSLVPRFRFNVNQRKYITITEQVDITSEREGQYRQILQGILDGIYPGFYDSVEACLRR